MDNRNRVPISVNIQPSDYAGRTIRLGTGHSDIRDKMHNRMREFELESQKWREQFLSGSSMGQPSLLESRPRMLVNFPDFPELSSGFNAPINRSGFGGPALAMTQASSHKSFIEEDDHGNKKYKMVFEIGDFKPHELQVKTEGRLLAVKGDREIQAGSATESKQFNREITLPDFVEPTSVTSFLSDGVLTLEAPVLLDRLGYSSPNALQNSATTSSSTMRNSPFRDIDSPSRLGGGSLLSPPFGTGFRKSHEDMLGMGAFNTPFFTDMNFSSKPTASSLSMQEQQHQRQQQHQQQQQQQQQQAVQQHQQQTAQQHHQQAAQQQQSNALSASNASYKFNMSEFRPEDISITVTDTTLKIHALREETDGGNGKTYRKRFDPFFFNIFYPLKIYLLKAFSNFLKNRRI